MNRRRPNHLPGLLVHLARAYLTGRRFWLLLLAVIVVAVIVMLRPAPTLDVATFNIEDYPKSAAQAAGALELIGSLDVDAVAVQEITQPAHFRRFARDYLGEQWRFVATDQHNVRHKVGLLFDDHVFELVEARTHHQTVVYRGARATLEVRLRTEHSFGARTVRLFVVHLKAGSAGAPLRRKQLRRLRPVLAEAAASGDEVILLGDFNTTGTADRFEVEALAEAVGLDWTSKRLRCTSFWQRSDACPGTPLDHILATDEAKSVRARGACETVGCKPGDACPAYVKMVSDHCPVSASF